MYTYLVYFIEFLILIFCIFVCGFCVTLYMQRWYKIVLPNWLSSIKTQKDKIKKWIVLPWKVIFFDYTTRLGYFYFSYIYFLLIFSFFCFILFLTIIGDYGSVFFLLKFFFMYLIASVVSKVIFIKHCSESSENNLKVAYPLDQIPLIIKWFIILFLVPLLFFINFFWTGSFTECTLAFLKPLLKLVLKRIYYLFSKNFEEFYNNQTLSKPLYDSQTELSVFKHLFPNFDSLKYFINESVYLKDVRWSDCFYTLKYPLDDYILLPLFSFFGIGTNTILFSFLYYYIVFFILYDLFFTFVFLLVFFLDRDKKHLTLFYRPKHFFKKKKILENYVYYLMFLTFFLIIIIFLYYVIYIIPAYWCCVHCAVQYVF